MYKFISMMDAGWTKHAGCREKGHKLGVQNGKLE